MPVDSKCPEYNEKSTQWKTVRDAVEGEIAIKNGKETYLPRPGGQSPDDYARYINRAGFVQIGEPITPRIDGNALDYIPFFTCPGGEPEKSMLLGLAFENIGHYQKTADYENACILPVFLPR
jgi:hypothetical protein